MSVFSPDETVQAAHETACECKRQLAILLFEQDRLTLMQAARLAGMPALAFQHLLARRGISPHYDVDEFEQDLVSLSMLKGYSEETKIRGLLGSD